MSLSVSRVSTHSWWIQLFELIRAYTLLHTVFLPWKANDATHTANRKETCNATYSKKFSFYNIFSFKLSISIFINNLTLNLRVPLWTVLQELLWSLLAKAMQDFSVTHGGREGGADRQIKLTPTAYTRYATLLRNNKLQYCTMSSKIMLREHRGNWTLPWVLFVHWREFMIYSL